MQISFLLIVSVFVPLTGQIISTDIENITYELRKREFGFEDQDRMYSDIKGDPYYYEAFTPGIIYINNTAVKANLRYNRYTEQPEILHNGYLYEINGSLAVDSVVIGDLRIVYSLIQDNEGKIDNGAFFAEINSGDYRLLERLAVKIKEEEPVQLFRESKPAEFIDLRNPFYIKDGDRPAVHIASEKDLEKRFGNEKTDMGQFLKENKISAKEKTDLQKVTAFLNAVK